MSQACGNEPSVRPRRELLGRFEECAVLAVMTCGPRSTAEDVRKAIEARVGDQRITTVVTTLDRLVEKGFLETAKEDAPTPRRGGRKRMLYSETQKGRCEIERSLCMLREMAQAAGVLAA